MKPLSGQTILILGAGGGLGAALVAACREAGATVMPHDGRKGALAADLSQPDAAARLVARVVAEHGPPTGLINAAASQDLTPGDAPGDWQRLMQVNVTSAVSAVRAVFAAGKGGAVVNIASVEALRPLAAHSAYAASKAAMVSATRSLAVDGAARGWRVNALLPGLIAREGLATDWPEGLARWQAAAPMARPVSAAEVASAAVFLLSPAASGITGVALPVDAGYLAAPCW